MLPCRGIAIIILAGFVFSADSTMYTGRVVSNSVPAIPLSNATVFVSGTDSCAYTDSLGEFTLAYSTSVIPAMHAKMRASVDFSGNAIRFICTDQTPVQLKIFTPDGRLCAFSEQRNYGPGRHTLSVNPLLPRHAASGLYLLSALIGTDHRSSVFLFTDRTVSLTGTTSRPVSSPARAGSTSMALSIEKAGYETRSFTLTDIVPALGDIVLDRTAKEAAIDRKVDSLLALMTIDEKAGQMVQAQINFTGSFWGRLTDGKVDSLCIGSVFNGGSDESAVGQPNTPEAWAAAIDRTQKSIMTSSRLKIPMLYGQDCVHGAGEINGCTVFPHNIGLGCTGDTALAAKAGRITAEECTGIGIRFNFAPCISSVRNERWGRTYEGFGETPEVNARMGAAYIRGLQGGGERDKIGAITGCAKHFLGDGGTDDGVNNGGTSIAEATMRAVHLPPYAAAVREQIATVMPSYHTWIRGGVNWKQTLDRYALTSILKNELGFDGFCISDWDAVMFACNDYKTDCVAKVVNAGLDMAMIIGEWNCGEFINSIKEGVKNGAIPQSRIDDAVRRILRIKFRFGLFDHPYSDPTLRARIRCAENRAVARECVRKSLVLLKNEENVLPLRKSEKITVVGPWANSLGAQCGGWTISWQGSVTHTGIAGQTILEGLRELGDNVTFSEDGGDIATADKIVVVVGENPYAEQYGDCSVPDLSECPNASLIEKCFNSGKPVVLVMVTGRPMVIDTEYAWCKAIVAAWLPGGEGGGVADVLFGDYNFSGTLTHTWPASAEQIPINAGPQYADEKTGIGGEPLFRYGFGMRYNW